MDFYPPIDWTKHPLHTAAIGANSSEVKRLIAEGADVNEHVCMDVTGRQDVAGSPLHVALRNCAYDEPGFANGSNHLEVVRLLLAAGANVRLRRLWEGTPLHDAAQLGRKHIAKLLICHGADVNSTEHHEGVTPLHLAAASGRLEMIEYLLSEGAKSDPVAHFNPELRHRGGAMRLGRLHGMTPLQLAVKAGHVAVVRRLLEAGASLDISTAIRMAEQSKCDSEKRYDEIIGLLNSNNPR
jgi:ankyrin repeat protein